MFKWINLTKKVKIKKWWAIVKRYRISLFILYVKVQEVSKKKAKEVQLNQASFIQTEPRVGKTNKSLNNKLKNKFYNRNS